MYWQGRFAVAFPCQRSADRLDTGVDVNYIGSKYSLLGFLEEGVLGWVDPSCRVFFDVFAGTGVVGWRFKQKGFRVVANDIQYYAYCLNRVRVQCNREPEFSAVAEDLGVPGGSNSVDGVLDHLNVLEGTEGFIYRTYCAGGTQDAEFIRQYFSDENGKRCDAIRMQIEAWRQDGRLTEDEYFYLLASLIDAADSVANTASVYGAFLKHIKKSAMKPLHMEPVQIVEGDGEHRVYNRNGSQLVGEVACDVLYMDPPYNHRQYCANYHMLETIARYDQPEVRGVTGLRPYDGQKSDFCMKRRALPAFEEMVAKTSARYVFLSYNSEGIMQRDEILAVMRKYGVADVVSRDYNRFRADVDGENRVYKGDRVEEYLFRVDKGGEAVGRPVGGEMQNEK